MAQLAAWSFDGTGNTVVDASGNGNDFSIGSTGATRVAGVHNEGLRYGGGSLPVLPDIGRTVQRSVSCWLKFVSPPTCWPIVWNAPSISSGAWGILMLSGSVHIQARSASVGPVRASIAWPSDGAPHFVAGTFDGSTVRISLDGGTQVAAALTGPLRTDTDPPQLFLDCGVMNGFIDDLRVHDHALTTTEITALMSAPVGAGADQGTLAGSLPKPAGAMSGTLRSSGTLAGSVPMLTGNMSAAAKSAGVLSGSFPSLAGSLVAAGEETGMLAGQLPVLGGSLAGSAKSSGSLAATIAPPSGSLAATTRDSGTVAGQVPAPVGSLSGGISGGGGVLAGSLPLPIGTFVVQAKAQAMFSGQLESLVGGLAGHAAVVENPIPRVSDGVTKPPFLVSKPISMSPFVVESYSGSGFVVD